MFVYDKKLQYPVKIANTNPRLAAIIISQYGGPDGELGASLRYLSQRYSMPFDELKGLLTDIGTGEMERHPRGTQLFWICSVINQAVDPCLGKMVDLDFQCAILMYNHCLENRLIKWLRKLLTGND